jgi:hypothetical protein
MAQDYPAETDYDKAFIDGLRAYNDWCIFTAEKVPKSLRVAIRDRKDSMYYQRKRL